MRTGTKRRWFLLLVVVLSGWGAAQPLSGRQTQKDDKAAKEDVPKELRQYYADLSARDWKAFADHFWPGATITTIWQPEGEMAQRVFVSTIPEFVAEAPKGPGSKAIFEEKMTGATVRLKGNLAQVWAGYEAKFGEPGKVAEWTGTDAFTLMKHEGRWRIVSLVFEGNE